MPIFGRYGWESMLGDRDFIPRIVFRYYKDQNWLTWVTVKTNLYNCTAMANLCQWDLFMYFNYKIYITHVNQF